MLKLALPVAAALLASCSRSSSDHEEPIVVVDRLGPPSGQPAPPINDPDPIYGATPTNPLPPVRRPYEEGVPGREPNPGAAPVPEPTTIVLVASGLAAFALIRRRRRVA